MIQIERANVIPSTVYIVSEDSLNRRHSFPESYNSYSIPGKDAIVERCYL